MSWTTRLIAAGLVCAAIGLPSISKSAAPDPLAERAATGSSESKDGLWKVVDENLIAARQPRRIVPQAYRSLKLDNSLLKSRLANAPLEGKEAGVEPMVLSLPMPDGSFAQFRIVESPIMAAELAAKFPEIRTYAGQGIDDPGSTLRFDVTPSGFHAQILSTKGTSYIDPFQPGDREHYIAYAKRDYLPSRERMQCLVTGSDTPVPHDVPLSSGEYRQDSTAAVSSGSTLRTYRLAVAATGEYTLFHGGTVAAGLAGIVTTMNRVNGIYEREVSVRMVLVANNDLIIYTNAATDPYANSSGDLNANQSTLDSIIGSTNYDIGHLVGTGGGGVASLRSPCSTSKARGLTGSSAPLGDAFDVDYVAHEMGHQFGGNHTFNGSVSSCSGSNRNASTSYEPGSGITIQAYAGICSADNLQSNSEDYFHRVSLDEILAFTTSGTGTCSVNTATGNTPPVVTAPADVTIPAQTPFTLTAEGTDANGDTLTYLWEEYDSSASFTSGPFAGGVLTDNGISAIFRSYAPTSSPTREFPSLRYQLANANTPPATSPAPGTTTPLWMTGEVLPTTTRAMKFRVTVRDNRAGGGGTNDDEMIVNTVSTAGPFVITAPNAATSWAAGSAQTVTWNVTNTDIAPINAANVRLKLSTDGGNSYAVVLAASVPNNGSANITVPANTPATLQGRVRVEAIGNIFFDISDANITITSANAAPTITVTGSVTTRQGSAAVVGNVATVADANGNAITVSLADVPPELTASVVNASGTVQLTAAAACSLVAPTSGNKVYPLTLIATDSLGSTAAAAVNVNVGSNLIPTLGTYANTTTFVSTNLQVTPSAAPSDGNGNLTGSASVSPTTLPGGGTVSVAANGVVTVNTTAGTTFGAYPIAISVNDSCGARESVSFVLTVASPDPSLSLADSDVTSGNALIEPNECNTLALAVANSGGSTASTVTSTLSTSTPGVSIFQPASAYANIAVGSQVLNTTPFQISTDSSVQCGTNISLTQTVTYAGNGSPVNFNFSLPVGQPPSENYVFTAGTGAAVPAGGVLLASSNADDAVLSLPVPDGFNFSVYNTAVAGGSTLRVSSNGNLQLAASGGSAQYNNVALPSTGSYLGGTFPAGSASLFPYWTDLLLNVTNGGIYTQLTGTAPNRQWIIEWRGRVFNDGASAINTIVALVLTEGTNRLEYRYLQTGTGASANGGDATIGIQAASSGSRFTQYSLNTASISAGTVLTATLPLSACTPGLGVCGAPPTPSLSVADVSVTEGNGGVRSATFTVLLSSPALSGGVSFNIATTSADSYGNAAKPGSDYAAASAVGKTIAAGQSSATFTVKIYGDTKVEQDELFQVIVSSVSGATVANDIAAGTILNDDAGSVLSVDDDSAPASTTSIASIQGNGLVSPLAGRYISARGIVTALLGDGFFLQAADGNNDADLASSEGLFVFTGAVAYAHVKLGNFIEIRGQVQETLPYASRSSLSLTRIAARELSLISSGHALPKPVVLDASVLRANRAVAWLERYEGMRVAIPRLTVVAAASGDIDETTALSTSDGRFYGVASGTARPFREPGLHSLEMAPLRAGVNPPVFDGNPERVQIDSLGQTGARALAVDAGDRVTGLVGVLSQGRGAYALLPDPSSQTQVVAGAVPRAVSLPSASDMTIGNFNARRFFDDRDDPTFAEPVLTAKAYALRLAKAANAICAYARNPDILGVAEVENLSTLSDMAEAVNSQAGNLLFPGACSGNPGYQAHLAKGNTSGNIGFLVSTASVRPGVARVQVLSTLQHGKSARFSHADGSAEALFEQTPMVMRARINKTDGKAELLTVIANQLHSTEGIDSDAPGSHGWATQGEYVRAKRRAQMLYMAGLIQSHQKANRRERMVVLGGFESNEFSDGHDDLMGLLTGRSASRRELLAHADSPMSPPLTNLTLQMPQAERYSVTREGNAEAVDHVLVNQSLLAGRYRLHTEYARINADFGEDNAGDFSVPLRVSDHDAVVLYLGEP